MTETVLLPPRYVSVEEELKRNPELNMSDLEMLKDWMDKQPHLPNIEMFYLALFLHSKYYNIEATKRTIEVFFTSRTHMPELFCNRDPITSKELQKTFNVIAAVPLEQQTKEGYIMVFSKLLDTNPSLFNQTEYFKYLLMTGEMQNVINGTSKGQVIIFDASGFSLGHIVRMNNVIFLKKLIFFIQEAVPVRLKAIHVLNTVPAVETFMNIVKPLSKMELFNIVHFHTSLETVKKFLPIEALPNESGGKAGPIKEMVDKNIKLLQEFRDIILFDERNYRVNESLRVSKSQIVEDLYGVDGSFRKLEVD